VHLVGFYSLLSSLMHGTMNLKFQCIHCLYVQVLTPARPARCLFAIPSMLSFSSPHSIFVFHISVPVKTTVAFVCLWGGVQDRGRWPADVTAVMNLRGP
jgi:hypothetical protein